MIMPFGKHKGEAVEDIPSDYLYWILYKSDIDDERIIEAVGLEYDSREVNDCHFWEYE